MDETQSLVERVKVLARALHHAAYMDHKLNTSMCDECKKVLVLLQETRPLLEEKRPMFKCSYCHSVDPNHLCGDKVDLVARSGIELVTIVKRFREARYRMPGHLFGQLFEDSLKAIEKWEDLNGGRRG